MPLLASVIPSQKASPITVRTVIRVEVLGLGTGTVLGGLAVSVAKSASTLGERVKRFRTIVAANLSRERASSVGDGNDAPITEDRCAICTAPVLLGVGVADVRRHAGHVKPEIHGL